MHPVQETQLVAWLRMLDEVEQLSIFSLVESRAKARLKSAPALTLVRGGSVEQASSNGIEDEGSPIVIQRCIQR